MLRSRHSWWIFNICYVRSFSKKSCFRKIIIVSFYIKILWYIKYLFFLLTVLFVKEIVPLPHECQNFAIVALKNKIKDNEKKVTQHTEFLVDFSIDAVFWISKGYICSLRMLCNYMVSFTPMAILFFLSEPLSVSDRRLNQFIIPAHSSTYVHT